MNTENHNEILAAKREYHRKWRAEHPESVKAAQMRYWAKKAEEMKASTPETAEKGGSTSRTGCQC